MQFKVLTYNIHKGIGGLDRKYQPDRIVRVIEHAAPDIVLLQEVDDDVPRSDHHRQVDVLAKDLGLEHSAYQPNVTLKQGVYGNAVLSRFPMKEVTNIDLTVGPKKRRGAQVVQLEVSSAQKGDCEILMVANVHLGLAGFERKMQLKRLNAEPVICDAADGTPMLIGGDFNDVWGSLGAAAMHPHGWRSATDGIRTFPAAWPLRALDAIFFRGPLEMTNAYAGQGQMARRASDHRPLMAEFRTPS